MIKILRGDDSNAVRITPTVPDGLDLAGAKLVFECGGLVFEFADFLDGVSFTFPRSWTASQPVGRQLGRWSLVWPGGRRVTTSNTFPVYLTDVVSDVGGESRADIALPEAPLEGLTLDPNASSASILTILAAAFRRLGGTVAAPVVAVLIGLAALSASAVHVTVKQPGEFRPNVDPVVTDVDLSGSEPGNYAAVSNAAMTAAQNATNLVSNATNALVGALTGLNPFGTIKVQQASMADWAYEADVAFMLGGFGEGAHEVRYGQDVLAQLDAATRTNAMQDARLIDATNETLRAAAEHTDSAIQSATSGLTELGDDRVYEAAGLGDFTWSSDRADILAALGSQQPHVGYESGGWAEYSLDFSVGETNYYGYAYVETSARTVSFDVYGWYYNWDDETGQEVYGEDAATVVGTRSPSSVVPTGDRYARQADMTSVQSEMSSLRALYNGETKVMRDGGEGQHGYGWGYLQHPLSGEARYWRIRVPKWTAFPGAATNNLSATNVYATMHAGPGRYPLHAPGAGRPIPLNPASWCPTWGVRRTLVATRGVNGSDAVAMADWDVGFSFLATNGTDRCAMNFHVTQTSSSPMSYSVTPDVTYMTPILIPTGADQSELAVSNVWYVRYVDLAPQSRSWVADGAEVETTVTVKGFLADPDQVETSANGVIPMTYWTVMDAVYRWRTRSGYSTGAWSSYVTARDMLTRFTAKATCASLSILENAKVPYYRLVTTLDGHLYYDAALDETYRIVSSNGVFFSEWHCDGDWRKREAQ